MSVFLKEEKRNLRKIIRRYLNVLIIDLLGGISLYINRLRPRKYNLFNKKILLLRLDAIGDVLVTTSAVRALRNLYPDAYIAICVSQKSKAIIDGNPYVNEIIVLDVPWYQRDIDWICRIRKIRDIYKVAKGLRRKNFDMVINLRPHFYHYDHLFSSLIGARRRIGLGMQGGRPLLTDIVPWQKKPHMIEQILDIVRYLGGDDPDPTLDVFIPNENSIYAKKLLEDNGILPNDLIIGINLCANYPIDWGIKCFSTIGIIMVKVIEILVRRYSAKIVFTGTANFLDLINKVRNIISVKNVSVVGETTLKQLVALIAQFDLLITVDSAPRHLASAIGIPVIVLDHKGKGGVNYSWGPYGKDHYFITDITPEKILTKIDEILK